MSMFMESSLCRPSATAGSNNLAGGGGGGDELKTQFMTREGTYRLMTLSEYSRPNRVGYANNSQGGTAAVVPVRVSFAATTSVENDEECPEERIAFNFGREIFIYPYKGLKKAADLTKPIDKRIYKGTCPTCHDFGSLLIHSPPQLEAPEVINGSINSSTSTSGGTGPPGPSGIIPLLVGFSGGQIQLIDPVRKELSKLFNEERQIDKTRVTCIKWIPNSGGNYFLASYSSGNMYVYNHDLPCTPTPPTYQQFKAGQGYSIQTCKTKTTRNPLYKWTVGRAGAVNEFSFSPCGHYLAVVSQDGYLRVFNYDTMEVVGTARSYFGGLLCVCWSPDGKYIAVGGEDDLVTLYSMAEKRAVVRGQGHKSWVSVVSFDQYNMSYGEIPDGLDFSGSDEEGPEEQQVRRQRLEAAANNGANDKVTCYRFGSVGQDTYLCLWDITESLIKSSISRTSCHGDTATRKSPATSPASQSVKMSESRDSGIVDGGSADIRMSLTHRLATLNFGDRGSSGRYKSGFSLGRNSNSDKSNGGTSPSLSTKNTNSPNHASWQNEDPVQLGSSQCPRINELPLIEPLVTKKVAHERLTALVFREDCLVTACQDGYVYTWARPGRESLP